MSQNTDINNHVIKGRLKDRFNDRALLSKDDLEHDKALDALEENNINTGLLMGSDTHIGRTDQFHYHEEKQRFDSQENQEKRSKKSLERFFLRLYLEQLQQTLDAIDQQIDKIKRDIEQTQMRLAEDMRVFGHYDNTLGKIDKYMNGELPKKQPGKDLADDDLTQLIILLGHSPRELDDAQVRKILDEATVDMRNKKDKRGQSIKDNTDRIDAASQKLDAKQRQRDRIQNAIDKTRAIANDESLDEQEKSNQASILAKESNLTMDDFDKIRDSIKDSQIKKDAEVLNEEFNYTDKSERSSNSDLDVGSLSAFMPKP